MINADYIADLAEDIGIMYDKLQLDILRLIQERAKKNITYNQKWLAKKAVETGALKRDVVSLLAKTYKKSETEILKIFKDSGLETIRQDNIVVNGKKLDLKLDDKQKRILNAGLKKANSTIRNMTGTTAKSAGNLFETITNDVYNLVSSGAISKDEAFTRVGKQLAGSNVNAVDYGERKMTIESAVRMTVRTGVTQTMLKLSEENCKQLETDLVETSAHSGARPSHASWQGKVFSLNGKSKKYPSLSQVTGYGTVGGLGGANCRHLFFPFIDGVDSPEYTDEELKEFRNEKVTYNGKKMSVYDAEQKMRYYERSYRKLRKDEVLNNTKHTEQKKKIMSKMKDLNQQTDVRLRKDRLTVYK